MKRLHALVATALLAAAPLASANLLTNGSFESGATEPPAVGQSFGQTIPSGVALPGWTILYNSVDRVVNTYWQASDGDYSLDLNGTGAVGSAMCLTGCWSAISQTFATVAGASYLLSFDLSGNPDGPPTTKSLFVNVVSGAGGGGSWFDVFDTTGISKAAMGWTTINHAFTAMADLTTLQFFSLTDSSSQFGPVIDNVAVVPEPGTYAMLLAGLGLLGFMARRRMSSR